MNLVGNQVIIIIIIIIIMVGNQVIAREEANAKGINFDRIVLELIMKMNRMQVFKKLVRTF